LTPARTSPGASRKLDLDPATVRRARSLARRAGRPIVALAHAHTTVSVERAVLRMAGVTGADPDGIPWVNRLVDAVRAEVGLEHGVALPVWDALRRGEHADLTELAQKASTGGVRFQIPEGRDATRRVGKIDGRQAGWRSTRDRTAQCPDRTGGGVRQGRDACGPRGSLCAAGARDPGCQ
jgi:hypothetical protein